MNIPGESAVRVGGQITEDGFDEAIVSGNWHADRF